MPYLNQDIVLYVDQRVILGIEGDEVVVISQRNSVLIVQHANRLSNPFPVTTQKIRNDEGKYTEKPPKENNQRLERGDRGRVESIPQAKQRKRVVSPKRLLDSDAQGLLF